VGRQEGRVCLLARHRRTDTTSVHSDQGSHGHCYNRSSELCPYRRLLYIQPTSEWWVKFGTVPHTHTHTRTHTHTHVCTNSACPSVPTHLHPSLSVSVSQRYLSNTSLSLSCPFYCILSLAYTVLVFPLSHLTHRLTPTDSEACAVQRRTHEVLVLSTI